MSQPSWGKVGFLNYRCYYFVFFSFSNLTLLNFGLKIKERNILKISVKSSFADVKKNIVYSGSVIPSS